MTGRDLDRARLGDHLDRLYRAAWALCGDHADAEDLVQETYARVLSRRRTVRRVDDIGYLMQALRNTFIDTVRAARARPVAADRPLDEAVADERAGGRPDRMAEAAEVYGVIAGLPGDFRDVIVAVDVVGLSYKETARALGIREGTVMSRLYRARERVVRAIDGDRSVVGRE